MYQNDTQDRNDIEYWDDVEFPEDYEDVCDGAESHIDLASGSICDNSESQTWGHAEGGNCIICKEPFEGLHLKSKQTCSDACRQRLSRMRKMLDSKDEKVLDTLDFYADCVDIPELREKSLAKLRQIRILINHIIEDAEE